MPDVEGSFRNRLPGYGPFVPSPVVVPLSSAVFVDPDTIVAVADQTGTPGAPFSTIQAAADVLAGRGSGTILLVPGIYPAEAVNLGFTNVTLMGLGSVGGGGETDLGAVTISTSGSLGLTNIGNVGAVTSGATVVMRDSFSNNTLQASALELFNSTVGNFTVSGVTECFSSHCLDGGSTAALKAHDTLFETAGNTFTFTGLGQLWDCEFFSDLLADSVVFSGCNLSGAFTGSTFTAYGSRLQGGSVTSTVQINVDQFSYQSATPASWNSTNLTVLVDTPWTPQLSQIGWNPALGVSSTLQQVLLANQHAPGLYLVYAPVVVRVLASAGTITRVISWSAPTIGAQSKTDGPLAISTTTGTKFQDVVAIVSNGSADVTVQYTTAAATGTPAIDVYAAANQAGARQDL